MPDFLSPVDELRPLVRRILKNAGLAGLRASDMTAALGEHPRRFAYLWKRPHIPPIYLSEGWMRRDPVTDRYVSTEISAPAPFRTPAPWRPLQSVFPGPRIIRR